MNCTMILFVAITNLRKLMPVSTTAPQLVLGGRGGYEVLMLLLEVLLVEFIT